jgi:hypothetical protein
MSSIGGHKTIADPVCRSQVQLLWGEARRHLQAAAVRRQP